MTTETTSIVHIDKKRKMSPAPENTKAEIAPTSNLLIKRLSEKAKLPTRGSALAAGYDLYRYATVFRVDLYNVCFGVIGM